MQISPARTDEGEAGYTLLELLVVVAVISMIIGFIPTIYSVTFPKYQVYAFADHVAAVSRNLRRDAQKEHETKYIEYFPEASRIVVENESLPVPDGVDVRFQSPRIWSGSDENKLEFYATGASSGGIVTISRGQVSTTIQIDWVSGAVRIER